MTSDQSVVSSFAIQQKLYIKLAPLLLILMEGDDGLTKRKECKDQIFLYKIVNKILFNCLSLGFYLDLMQRL